jgi:Excalibur calcium-binding domain
LATPNASNAGGYVTFKGETNDILNGRWADLPNSTVTILYLMRGTTTWHTFAQFTTNSTGNYSQRYRFNFTTTVHFHARVEPTPFTARSYSPLVDVVPLTVYANCTALHTTYQHGVAGTGARDHVTSGTPVTSFFVSSALYDANTKLDRDKDGVACEAH